ncbi:major facilitator superfamily domain-containing protein [Phascolomyces articulosus]|uniref:Major facilitator superfamily domain-containing protein n=1 Tax=Phascolomyces articulosus TaxID=60185 RepID=A0AAD5K9U0_9FUNG|nr:major facilitator superfamily domain-containing protein [Phascolomyces articulosus]
MSIALNEERKKQERQLVRKIDLHVMPLFCLFYFVDYLDRSNVSNAVIAGLKDDINLQGTQFSTSVSVFFITYIMFQIPSNMVLKRIGARLWLSIIILVWGLITLSMALLKDFTGLVITRLFLGAAESGFVPGILFQMSRIYKPQELGFRISLLICMAASAGVAAGPIAYAASKLGDKSDIKGWRYIFIFEGAPTILLSLLSFWLLFDDISNVGWLTSTQKQLQEARMAEYIKDDRREPITLKTIQTVFMDIKTWVFSVMFTLTSINLTSITTFSPIIIKGFGFSSLTTQLLTAPPSVIAALLILICGLLADRGNKRAIMVASGSCLIALGFLLLAILDNRWGSYGAIFVVAAGMGIQAPIGMSWSTVNYPDLTVRAVAVAVVSMMGNIGNVAASYLYQVPESDALYLDKDAHFHTASEGSGHGMYKPFHLFIFVLCYIMFIH